MAFPIFGWVYELAAAVRDFMERVGQLEWEMSRFLLFI
jgi:hypothetical protein